MVQAQRRRWFPRPGIHRGLPGVRQAVVVHRQHLHAEDAVQGEEAEEEAGVPVQGGGGERVRNREAAGVINNNHGFPIQ